MTTNRIQHRSKFFKEIKRLLHALFYSFCGLKVAFKGEAAFRLEICLSVFIIPLALYLDLVAVKKVMLVGSWMLVIIVEIINSSIESVVDRISLDLHPLSKKIKDMASAAVFLALINAIIVWFVIIFSR